MMRPVILLWLLPLTALAGPPPAVLGTWGTAEQCAGALLKPGGTVRAAPVTIHEGWLQQRDIWCRLTWFDPQERGDGVFVAARALCGEDSANAYGLGLALAGDTLTLIWDEALANGPLRRCDAPDE